MSAKGYLTARNLSDKLNFVGAELSDFSSELISKLKSDVTAVLILETNIDHGIVD